jgi:hypothetical protein
MALCDQVTVMRGGQVVLDTLRHRRHHSRRRPGRGHGGPQGAPGPRGRHRAAPGAGAAAGRRGPELARRRWACRCWRRSRCSCAPGEIVGVAGVSGNGQSELLDVLSGLHAPHSGSAGRGRPALRRPPLAGPASGRANCASPTCPKTATARPGAALPGLGVGRAGLPAAPALQPARLDAPARDARRLRADDGRYDVRPRNPLLRSSKFSGGNQQKLVLAREACPSRRCCWWASRRAAWTSAPSSSSTAACAPCATPAARCWWCQSSSTRSWRWPTA